MINLWLVILRIISILQIVAAIYKCFTSLIGLFQDGSFIYFLQAVAFGFIAALPVQVFIIINNNYPDKPIEGMQKRNFNRMFLINAFLLSFLFGFVFYDLQEVFFPDEIISMYEIDRSGFVYSFIISVIMLIFQLAILFGLFWLRNIINLNTNKRQFDFEMKDETV